MSLRIVDQTHKPVPQAPIYSRQVASKLGKSLADMAAKPKGLVLRDLVQLHKTRIRNALAQGYSYEDVISLFVEHGVSISINTLKQYLRGPSDVNKNHADVDFTE